MSKPFTLPENIQITRINVETHSRYGYSYACRKHHNGDILRTTGDEYEYLSHSGVWEYECTNGWFKSEKSLLRTLRKSLKSPIVPPTESEKIAKALEYAVKYGGIDGAHHKDWVIDQMVRALTGCPEVKRYFAQQGKRHSYTEQGKSEDYKKLVKEAKAGSDGPNTYSWETGIAP